MFHLQEIEQNWVKLVELSDKRNVDLDGELATQQEHEKLRLHFAELANTCDKWMQEHNEVGCCLRLLDVNNVVTQVHRWNLCSTPAL